MTKYKMTKWGTPVELERRRRIFVSLWAYAYEYVSQPIVDDYTFDKWSSEIDPYVLTGHKRLDKFFMEEFEPQTGMWIRKHPEIDKVQWLYNNINLKSHRQHVIDYDFLR